MSTDNYRLLALDMDGTLLNSQHQILESSYQAIQKVKEQGVKVVLATGRHHLLARPYHAELKLDTPIICCNGTYAFETLEENVFNANPLSRDQAETILNIGEEMGIGMAMYVPDAMIMSEVFPYFAKMKPWAESLPAHLQPTIRIGHLREEADNAEAILKFVYTHANDGLLREAIARVNNAVDVSAEYSWVDRVDISNRNNSKGAALQKLAESYGLNMNQVVAVGDNENDISMLKVAGAGIAMKGEESVEQIADFVIGTNDENTVEQIINEFFL